MNRFWIAALALLGGCATAPLENVPLVWKPTTGMIVLDPADRQALRNARLEIVPAVDKRGDPGLIGRNHGQQPPRLVTTRDEVAAFVTRHMGQMFSAAGVRVVESGGTAILNTEVRQFFVDEMNTYQAEVILLCTLAGPDGSTLWTGITSGLVGRYGRAYRADNYYESLSDALVAATRELLRRPAFREALAGGRPPV